MTATNSSTAALPDTAYLPARISSGLTNSDCGDLIGQLRSFDNLRNWRAGWMVARADTDRDVPVIRLPYFGAVHVVEADGEDRVYVVVSYQTVIAIYDPQANLSRVPDASYSVTTSQQQHACRNNLPRVVSEEDHAVEHIAEQSVVKFRPGAKFLPDGFGPDHHYRVRRTHPMARTAQLWRNSYRDPEPPFVPVRSLELA